MYIFIFGKIFRVFSYFEDNCFCLSHFPIASNVSIKLSCSLLYLFLSHIYTHNIPGHFWSINKWLIFYLPFLINISFKCLSLVFGYFVFFCYLIRFIYINFEQFSAIYKICLFLKHILFLFLNLLFNASLIFKV